MDLKGVGLRSITQVYSYIQQTSVIGQNYYPERMGEFDAKGLANQTKASFT